MYRKWLRAWWLFSEYLSEIRRRIRRGLGACWGAMVTVFYWLLDWETNIARVLKGIASPFVWAFEYAHYSWSKLMRRWRAWLDIESMSNATRLDYERDQAVLRRLEARNEREARKVAKRN